MIDLKAIRAAAEAAKGLPEGVWNYEPRGQTVWNGKTHMVCDIRGWGHLQHLTNGSELQDAMGQHIANLNPATILELLDKLEAAEKDAARLDWLFSNPLIALDMIGCHRVNELHFVRREIDSVMKEQK